MRQFDEFNHSFTSFTEIYLFFVSLEDRQHTQLKTKLNLSQS